MQFDSRAEKSPLCLLTGALFGKSQGKLRNEVQMLFNHVFSKGISDPEVMEFGREDQGFFLFFFFWKKKRKEEKDD